MLDSADRQPWWNQKETKVPLTSKLNNINNNSSYDVWRSTYPPIYIKDILLIKWHWVLEPSHTGRVLAWRCVCGKIMRVMSLESKTDGSSWEQREAVSQSLSILTSSRFIFQSKSTWLAWLSGSNEGWTISQIHTITIECAVCWIHEIVLNNHL